MFNIHRQSSGGTQWKINILTFLLQNSQKNTCVGLSLLIKLQPETYNFIKIKTQTRVFFYEFCEISKHLFYRTPLVAAFPRSVFQIKVAICSAFFSTLIFFAGVFFFWRGKGLCITNKNLFTQTEKLEHILLVLHKTRNQM